MRYWQKFTLVILKSRIKKLFACVRESFSSKWKNKETKDFFIKKISFFSRNSFPIYASTFGTEETSEADDVFNEKADLSLFRDNKLKNSHENEVIFFYEYGKNPNRFFFIFLFFLTFRIFFSLRRMIMMQIAVTTVHLTLNIQITIAALMSMRTSFSIRKFIQVIQVQIYLKKI